MTNLIITAGLTGTGKSTLANTLASREGMEVISSDITRKKLAGIPLNERHLERFDKSIYSPEFSRKTYQQMLDQARQALSRGKSVIIDASFKEAAERERAMGLAKEMSANFLVIECVLDQRMVKERLEQRIKEGSVSDGRWEIWQQQKKNFDNIDEVPLENHVVINTSRPAGEVVDDVARIIESKAMVSAHRSESQSVIKNTEREIAT